MTNPPMLRHVSLQCRSFHLVLLTLALLPPVLLPLCAVAAPALRG